MAIKSALDVIREKAPAMTGFQSNPENDNNILFSTPLGPDKKRYFVNFRIGKEAAQKAGLSEDDTVMLKWDDEKFLGWIVAVPHDAGGWKLSKGSKSDTPPLVLRFTWKEELPSIDGTALCKVIEIGNRMIQFKFPESTSFLDLAKRDGFDDLYDRHRNIVERDNIKSAGRRAKKQELNRRKTDEAPATRDGKPYGRRKGDI